MDDQLRLEIDDSDPLHALWNQVLEHADERLGSAAVAGWLRDTALLSQEDGTLVLGVPNATSRDWIERKYRAALLGIAQDLGSPAERLQVVVHKGKSAGRRAPRKQSDQAPERPRQAAVSPLFAGLPLNDKFTFDAFVVGTGNRFAEAAARAVSARPGREYNPLFLWGDVGLGKTHLLQAIGHEIRRRSPRSRVAYVSGETFTSHFVTSIREHREEEFRRAYRSVDIWLVDDVQYIAGKPGTREEFFHTFNELYLTNRQIVLAADRPPAELRLSEDRLRTRLEAGLMTPIGPPDLETRVAILQRRAQADGATLSEEVAYQIASVVSENVRQLEAALIRVLAVSSLGKCDLTPETALRAIASFVQDTRRAGLELVTILHAVAEHFQMTEKELIGPGRDRHTSMVRQVAMFLMRELTGKSLTDIGEYFGGKAHSTVLYACRRLEEQLEEDRDLDAAVRSIRQRLASGQGSRSTRRKRAVGG